MSLPVEKKDKTTEIIGLNQLERAADYIVKSKLFGVQTREQAVALMLLAQAEGIHPMKAIKEYHIIQGRPALKADAMLARFLQSGGKVKWHKLTETECEATFSHPQGGEVTIRWTLEMAKKAGLTDKKNKDGSPNNWQKYPRAMLRARVISEGIRTVYPVVCVGVYTPEEVVDFDDEVKEEVKTVEAEVVQESVKKKKEQPAREVLKDEFLKLFKQLNWTREQGKAFLKEHFGKEATNELTDEEIAELIKLMQDELEKEEDIPLAHQEENKGKIADLWKEVHEIISKTDLTWDGVVDYIKDKYKKDPDDLNYDEVKEILDFMKETAVPV